MRARLIALVVIVAADIALPIHRAQEPATNPLVLWYRAPAANWNEGLLDTHPPRYRLTPMAPCAWPSPRAASTLSPSPPAAEGLTPV